MCLLQGTLKLTWLLNVSMSTSRRTMWSLRSSRTSCNIFIKPSQTWSIRRFTSCRPTVCPARALSRRSTRSRMFMRTGAQPYGYVDFSDVCREILMYHHILFYFSWNKLTERFFKTSPWPEAEAIASLVGNGEWIRFFAVIRNPKLLTEQFDDVCFFLFCFCWLAHVVLSVTDAVFLILYKELYYRHIYAKVSVSVFAHLSC